MWTVKEEDSKEHDFQLDLVHPMLMVCWIMGVCPFPNYSDTVYYLLLMESLFLWKMNLIVSGSSLLKETKLWHTVKND